MTTTSATRSVPPGKGGGASKTRSRFLSLETSIVDGLRSLHYDISVRNDVNRLILNPRDAISADVKIRNDLIAIVETWRELEGIHDAEARKTRSKFASDELDDMRRT